MERNNMHKNGIPQFDGKNYAFWSRRMKTYVQAHEFEVWKSIVDGYKEPIVLPTNDNGRKIILNNSKEPNSLMNGLCDSVYVKFIHCSSGREIWEKPQNIYEGDAKVKATKIQTYIGQFEQLKMKEDENIECYFLRVEETVN